MLKKVGIFIMSFIAVFMTAVADTPQNPRVSSAKNDIKTSSRTTPMGALTRRAIGETRVRAGTSSRAASRAGRVATDGTRGVGDSAHADSGRAAVSRSATASRSSPRVSGGESPNVISGLSRAATTARATAVFNDLSKIGSGYAACRESYATCMDQMCANANDTYRRCFCSDRFTKFRRAEESLDEAMIMLQQFQDNNLEAVDKTAAEVNAMYSASIGEAAIKKDTSASAKLLDNITKLLSGEKSSTASNTGNSIGILDLDFSVDFDDIWSDGVFSLFDTGNQDLSTLEGTALFNAAQRQCTRLTQNMCENNAVFTMSRSSYNILISQDCNTYEKALNKKKETVAQAVRTAEKYLREARLEEYRAHNSMDVNECLGKVRTAMLSDTACGENYKRCLDATGKYINPATGEPIDNYRPWFFELEQQIDLSGDVGDDILQRNKEFNNFLEKYRQYVSQQLDTCRSIADFVWTEFKRNAIIEIAQAQANKIEEVKSSCIDTIAECYDEKSQSIVNLGSASTSTTAGALGRYTARYLCRERVTACAALYSRGGENCKFDNQGHLTNDAAACGLASLINYVNVVDELTAVEKCKAAVDNYLAELCTPDNGIYEYPYNCRQLTGEQLRTQVGTFVQSYCVDTAASAEERESMQTQLDSYTASAVSEIQEDVRTSLADICESLNGHWYPPVTDNNNGYSCTRDGEQTLTAFYNNVWGYGTTQSSEWGCCYVNSDRNICEEYNTGTEILTRWNSAREQCEFTDAWYEMKCEQLGGYYDNSTCYVPEE